MIEWRILHCAAVLLLWFSIAVPAAGQYSIRSSPTCPNGVCENPSWRPVRIEPGTVAGPPAVRAPRRAVCRVINSRTGGTNVGSGTLIDVDRSRGLVLTCAHLFREGQGTIVAQFSGGRRFGATLIRVDEVNDLAALRIRDPGIAPAEASAESLVGGLTACGFGSDGQLACTAGNVIGFATPQGAVHPSARISGAVRPGDSGGGVFNEQGKLVAVVWGAREGTSYATFGKPLRDFLRRVMNRSNQGMVAVKPAVPRALPVVEDNRKQGTSRGDGSLGLVIRLDALDKRLGRLETKFAKIPAVDQLATRAQLERFVRREELREFAARSELAELHQRALQQQTTLRGELQQTAKRLIESAHSVAVKTVEERLPGGTGWMAGLSTGRLLASALGLGGPVGLALAVGLYFRFRRHVYDAPRFGAGSPKPSRHAGDAGRASPIAVDSPPLPQRTLPETHYVPYERDSFSKAYQWASEQVVRKYPGSVETLNALDSLIKQQVNAGS